MILNMTAGGAGGSVSVRGYETLPETAPENEIAVITADPVAAWVVSPSLPEAPEEGTVWIMTGTVSRVAFNILQENALVIAPSRVRQYISGQWTARQAFVRRDGQWLGLAEYFYDSGVEYNTLVAVGKKQDASHGVAKAPTLTRNEADLKISLASTEWYSGIVYGETPVDLTGFTTVHIRYNSFTGKGSGDSIRLVAYTQIGSYLWSNKAAEVSLEDAETTAVLDISQLSGEHILGLGVQNHSNSSGTMSVVIEAIWLE